MMDLKHMASGSGSGAGSGSGGGSGQGSGQGSGSAQGSGSGTVSPAFQEQATFHALGSLGIEWGTIWSWVQTYGLPTLTKVLALIGPLLQSNPTAAAVIAWIEIALQAVQSGQPVPPFQPAP